MKTLAWILCVILSARAAICHAAAEKESGKSEPIARTNVAGDNKDTIAIEIHRLSGADKSDCKSAVKKLVEIGKPALPALVNALSDPSNDARAYAAEALRAILAADPGVAPYHHEKTFWEERIAQLKPGMALDEALKLLLPDLSPTEREKTLESAGWSGQTGSCYYRLDDYWRVVLYLVHLDHEKLHDLPPTLKRSVRQVWVKLPDGFTGVWTTWHVNGQKANEIQCKNEKYDGTFTAFYDDGSKSFQQHYITGVGNGFDEGWYRSGKKMYEGMYENGKQIGTWQWWYENGRKQSVSEYFNGKLYGTCTNWFENGQKQTEQYYKNGISEGSAAWDQSGKLLYSNGDLQQPP